MPNFSVPAVSKRVVQALHDGEIDTQYSYKLFTQCALEQFPDCRNEAEATEKFRQTPHGQAWFNAERECARTKMQVDGALSANEPLIAKFAKLGGGHAGAGDNPASEQSEFETPSVEAPSNEPRTNAGGPPLSRLTDKELFVRAVEYLAQQHNISRDEAISLIYRAEKAAKAAGYTDPKPRYAKPEPAKPMDGDDDEESASEKVARLLKSYPNMSPDAAHTVVHRQERMKKFGF